jgi:Fe-S-cluster containining protein
VSGVDLRIEDGRIELQELDSRASLRDLADAVERVRRNPELVTAHCAGCAGCCSDTVPILGLDLAPMEASGRKLVFPSPPDAASRSEAIEALIRDHKISAEEAQRIHDHNNAAPITMVHTCGHCEHLVAGGFCGVYEERPYICRLYVCNMGERLEALYESIVAFGTWHAYHLLGWIDEEALSGNPFLGAKSWDVVPAQAFEVDLGDAMEKLFFFF